MRNLILVLVGLTSMGGCVSSSAGGAFPLFNLERVTKPSDQGKAYAHFLTAILLEQQGRYDEALVEMQEVPNLDAKAVTPTMRLIRAYLRQRDYESALNMADRSVKQDPDKANLWIVLGEIYHQLKQYEKATDAFSRAIELNPDNLLGYGALVELQENTNDLVAAIDIYHRLIEMNPRSAGLYYQLGINLIRIDDSDGAQTALAKALELSPSLVRARYLLSILYLEANKNEEARAELEQYLSSRPDDLQAAQNYTGALVRLGRYPEAIDQYQKILASDDVSAQQYLNAMYLYVLAGDPQRAETLAPANGAPILGTLLRAIARREQGMPYRALLESLDSVEGDLDDECSTFLNDVLYLFGREETGGRLLEMARSFGEEGIRSRTLDVIRARTLMYLDRFPEAAEAWSAILENYLPDETTHYYLAVVFEELDRFEDTESHLKQYLEMEPDDAEVMNFLGYLYAEKGVKLDEAEKLLQRALQAHPENPFYLDSLGWVYYRMGKPEEAIDLIQRAIYGMESDDAVLRDHLGDAYLLKGDVKRAIAEWERALRLDADLEGVQEKLDGQRPRPSSKTALRLELWAINLPHCVSA